MLVIEQGGFGFLRGAGRRVYKETKYEDIKSRAHGTILDIWYTLAIELDRRERERTQKKSTHY